MRQLDGLVHRVQADGDAAGAQRAVVGDGELGRVLQEDGDAVARRDPAALQETREASHREVQLGEGDRPPVELDRRTFGDALRLPRENDGQDFLGQADRALSTAAGQCFFQMGSTAPPRHEASQPLHRLGLRRQGKRNRVSRFGI